MVSHECQSRRLSFKTDRVWGPLRNKGAARERMRFTDDPPNVRESRLLYNPLRGRGTANVYEYDGRRECRARVHRGRTIDALAKKTIRNAR